MKHRSSGSSSSAALAVPLACCALLLACCGLLLAPSLAAAMTNAYTEGTATERGFSIDRWDEGWSWDQTAADQSLILTLDGLEPLSTPAITSTQISGVFSLNGQPVKNVGFAKFVLHVDIDIEGGFSPLPVVSYTSRRDGSDFHNANVSFQEPGLLEFTPPQTNYDERPGGAQLTYRISFQVPSGGASGTITINDFTLEYEEYVAPPEDDDDDDGGGGDGGDRSADDDPKDKPSGVAYMGGSDGGSGSGTGGPGDGTGGTGTDSGQGGGTSAGVRVGEGAGSVTTDAAVTVSPRSTSGDTVTGYPLRLADVTGGTADGGSGAGSGGDTCEPDAAGGAAGSGLSLTDLLWLAAALAVATPFAMAEVERRRVRRRLSDLVDETPDGPAPRITVPA